MAGTSYYQANLWCLAGKRPGGKRVQRTVTALLVTEDANPHDGNAIAVWIDGLRVGHLAQEDAATDLACWRCGKPTGRRSRCPGRGHTDSVSKVPFPSLSNSRET